MSTLRGLLCGLSILASIILALCVIKKYERSKRQHSRNEEEEEYIDVVYEDDVWKSCWKRVHPTKLMVYRIFAFLALILLLLLNTIGYYGRWFPFFYYTEWTSILSIIYFLLGSFLSIYGCYRKIHNDRTRVLDEEHPTDERRPDKVAGVWGYVLQILYQMLAGAIVASNYLYWSIVLPTIVININQKLGFVNRIEIILHFGNSIFFLIEVALNSLRFPWFRIAYFVLWSCSYVVFHWILQECITIGWPYPFLSLTYRSAPLWYFLAALSHVPFYAVIFGVIKLKQFVLKNFLQDR